MSKKLLFFSGVICTLVVIWFIVLFVLVAGGTVTDCNFTVIDPNLASTTGSEALNPIEGQVRWIDDTSFQKGYLELYSGKEWVGL